MTDLYRKRLRRAIKRFAKYGVIVEYISKQPPLFGQGINVDDTVEVRYMVQVIFVDHSRGRDGGDYLPRKEFRADMAEQPFKPKSGDRLITPQGLELAIDNVAITSPAGSPLMYRMRFLDG